MMEDGKWRMENGEKRKRRWRTRDLWLLSMIAGMIMQSMVQRSLVGKH